MDFAVPDELTALRSSFAAFLERGVRPIEEKLRGAYPDARIDETVAHDAATQVKRLACAEGFYAAHLPEEVGGWGLSTLGMTLLVEDAARSGLRLAAYAVAPPNPEGPTALLLDMPRELWPTYVLPVVHGEQTMCFALTEPEAGSDAQAIRTHAARDGDEWVINGHKHYITNADRADFAVVFAVTDAEKRAAGGITAFVVPRAQFTVGKKQYTVADTHPAELFFDNARVPANHVIGDVGLGFLAAMRFLNAGRAYIGAQCLGLAELCLDEAIRHTTARTAFGKPLAKFQGVAFPLAESKAEIEAMRWLTYHLAWSIDAGEEPMLDASIVKYFNTERAYAVADRCLQTFGGMGLLKDGPIEWVLRHLRMLRVVEGASEVQLLVISRALGL
ncbi:MAG: acyl-CoA dehydrogenase family protein [Frankia sp.]|nr:acyl-CoA dehydrogenase family protein [Frankia sp.]